MFKRFCILILMFSSAAHAGQAAMGCTELAENAAGVGIQNTCNVKLNVRYCVNNDNSTFSCRKNKIGLKTIKPGDIDWIPYYKSEGGGVLSAVACVHPSYPRNWNPGPGATFTCS